MYVSQQCELQAFTCKRFHFGEKIKTCSFYFCICFWRESIKEISICLIREDVIECNPVLELHLLDRERIACKIHNTSRTRHYHKHIEFMPALCAMGCVHSVHLTSIILLPAGLHQYMGKNSSEARDKIQRA